MAGEMVSRRARIVRIVLVLVPLLAGCAAIRRHSMERLTAALARQRKAATDCTDRVTCVRADAALTAAVSDAEKAGVENREVGAALTTLATLRRQSGKPAEADALLDRAASVLARVLATQDKTLGADHPETVATLEDLALLHVDRRRPAEATPLLERVVAGAEGRLGRTSPGFDQRLELLATTYADQQRDADAERTYRRLVAVREETLGREHPKVGVALDGVAESCRRQGRMSEAETLYRRALSIEEPALRADTPAVVVEFVVLGPDRTWGRGRGWPLEPVRALEGLARMYRAQDRDPEIRVLCESALPSREQLVGANHPFVGTVLERLAEVDERLGAYAQAEAAYRRLLAIKEKRLGPEDPQLADALRHHATVLWKLGRDVEGDAADRRAAALERRAVLESGASAGTSPQPVRVFKRRAPLD